jgi:hypothetical protein
VAASEDADVSLEAFMRDLMGRDRTRPPRRFKVAEGVASERWPHTGDVLMIHGVGPLLVQGTMAVEGRCTVFYVPYDDDTDATDVWRMRGHWVPRGRWGLGRSVEEEAFPA